MAGGAFNSNSTFKGSAVDNAAIGANAALTVTNCTFSSNSASDNGSAISNGSFGGRALLTGIFRLQHKIALSESSWQSVPDLADLTPVGSGPAQFTDPGAVSLGKAFYRVTPVQ